MNPVHVIGMGLGPACLTREMTALIDEAQVLAGGARLLDGAGRDDCERIVLKGSLEQWLSAVAEAAGRRRVVVLASGDPGFFGVAAALRRALGPDNVRVLPNITALQAACARLGLSWGGAAHVSLHASADGDLAPLWRAMDAAPLVGVYTRPGLGPAQVAGALCRAGLGHWRVHVLENMGGPGEAIHSLEPCRAAAMDFAGLNMIVLERIAPDEPLGLGLPEEAYDHEKGLITKAEVRAVALAKLSLGPGMTLWDIGAGSGSLGLEACLLIPGGRVFSLEKDPKRLAMIRANRARFGRGMLEPVGGNAPDVLAGLPVPQRVFIGGGGRRVAEIIETAARALTPGGVVVLAGVLSGTIDTARRTMAAVGLAVDETLVQVSRSAPLAGQTMQKALNPVWLIRGEKAREDMRHDDTNR